MRFMRNKYSLQTLLSKHARACSGDLYVKYSIEKKIRVINNKRTKKPTLKCDGALMFQRHCNAGLLFIHVHKHKLTSKNYKIVVLSFLRQISSILFINVLCKDIVFFTRSC